MYTLNCDICFYRSRAMQKTINGVLMAYWGKKGLRLCCIVLALSLFVVATALDLSSFTARSIKHVRIVPRSLFHLSQICNNPFHHINIALSYIKCWQYNASHWLICRPPYILTVDFFFVCSVVMISGASAQLDRGGAWGWVHALRMRARTSHFHHEIGLYFFCSG
jgi:hypothetical protein